MLRTALVLMLLVAPLAAQDNSKLRVIASVQAVGAPHYLEAKGHKP